jgi:hypothetical protein
LPGEHISGVADLALHGSDCLGFSSIGGLLLSAHINAIYKSECSDEGLSDSTLTGDRSTCLGSLVNMVDIPISLELPDLFLCTFLGFFRVVFRAEGPPMSITLSIL